MSSARDVGVAVRQFQLGMPNFVAVAVFVVLVLASITIAGLVGGMGNPVLGFLIGIGGTIASALIAASIKVANQWERALVLRLGRFEGIRGPGVFLIAPIFDRSRIVDMRVQTVYIRRQEVITRDNVPVAIDSVLFFMVRNVEDAVMKVQDFIYAITQLAQTALRDVIGGMTLDELLAERERIEKLIQEMVEKDAEAWGLQVTAIRLMDINMPEDLKRIMSRQAAAEREKRATITKAEGDKLAAENLAAAATTMARSPGAMQLRTLQTIDGLGPTASNTVVLAVPIEIMDLVRKIS
jgi:regulator of protease activity HflC (stomatin/prohibitin superfamily)